MIEITELSLVLKIILVLIFSITFVYFFWITERKYLKNESTFDISIGLLLGGGIGARIFGMIASSIDYTDRLWSFFPIAEIDSTVKYFHTMPWAFFDIFDKQLSFIGFLLGIVITLIIIYRNSNKARSLYAIYDSVILSFIGSLLLFLVASIYGQFDYGVVDESLKFGIVYMNEGVLRFPIQIYEGSVILTLGIVYLLTKRYINKNGLWTGIFLTIVGAFEFYIHYRSAFYNPIYFGEIDLCQIVSISIFLFGLYIIVSTLSINFFVKKKKILKSTVRPRSIDGNFSRLDTARKVSKKNITSFSQSFADRQDSIMDSLRDQEGK